MYWLFIYEMLLSIQTLVNEVNNYGEKKTTVENAGLRLTELSRKDDCDVIHNLIMTVQDRYKKLQQRTSERGRMLEDVKKNAKQVYFISNIQRYVTLIFLTRVYEYNVPHPRRALYKMFLSHSVQ